jgi:DNA recombination protein Rad52
MDWNAIKPHLEAKLDKAHVRPASKWGPKGDYIEGWHVIAEANRIFGFGGWSYHIRSTNCVSQAPRKVGKEQRDGHGVTYVAEVIVEVEGVQRTDVGAGHGYDVDLGIAHESAIKEAVTDALKRALRTFGNPFGLALYDKTRANVGTPEPHGIEAQRQAFRDSLKAETPHDPRTGEVYDERNPPPPPDPAPEIDEGSDTPAAWIAGAKDKLGLGDKKVSEMTPVEKRKVQTSYVAMLVNKLGSYKASKGAVTWITQFEQTHAAYVEKLDADLQRVVGDAVAEALDRASNPGHDPADFAPIGTTGAGYMAERADL